MMTLVARLCALCAVCALMQMISPEKGRGSLRLIGGLLMLHLVLFGARELCAQILEERELMRIFELLMK